MLISWCCGVAEAWTWACGIGRVGDKGWTELFCLSSRTGEAVDRSGISRRVSGWWRVRTTAGGDLEEGEGTAMMLERCGGFFFVG